MGEVTRPAGLSREQEVTRHAKEIKEGGGEKLLYMKAKKLNTENARDLVV